MLGVFARERCNYASLELVLGQLCSWVSSGVGPELAMQLLPMRSFAARPDRLAPWLPWWLLMMTDESALTFLIHLQVLDLVNKCGFIG